MDVRTDMRTDVGPVGWPVVMNAVVVRGWARRVVVRGWARRAVWAWRARWRRSSFEPVLTTAASPWSLASLALCPVATAANAASNSSSPRLKPLNLVAATVPTFLKWKITI
jgi:hypothetical protein